MSGRSFRSVFMVASCAGAALGCYLVSLRVASERAALQEVETRIVIAQRDIRLLETEIGTRGRLAQLERWNVRVLALSAPTADQFLDGGFALARLMRPEPKIELEAPVVLATAPADAPRPRVPGESLAEHDQPDEAATAEDLLHVASLERPSRQEIAAARHESGRSRPDTSTAPHAGTRKPVRQSQEVEKKAGDKLGGAASASVTKPAETAKVDPLAPLAALGPRTKKDADSVR